MLFRWDSLESCHCPPCLASLPSKNKNFNQHNGKDFQPLSVNMKLPELWVWEAYKPIFSCQFQLLTTTSSHFKLPSCPHQAHSVIDLPSAFQQDTSSNHHIKYRIRVPHHVRLFFNRLRLFSYHVRLFNHYHCRPRAPSYQKLDFKYHHRSHQCRRSRRDPRRPHCGSILSSTTPPSCR